MTQHYVAQIETTTGPMKIGISNIGTESIGPAFEVLMFTLSQVSDPVTLADEEHNIDIYEVLDRSPEVSLQFDYLGLVEKIFPNEQAFNDSMNESLAKNQFQCATSYDQKPDGSLECVFETFLLVDQPQIEH